MLEIDALDRPGLAVSRLRLEPGEALAVMGPSGAGKSLLLRAIADLDPNSGRLSLDGTPRQNFSAPEWRRRVTYVGAVPGWWAERVRAHFRPDDRDRAGAMLPSLRLPAAAMDWEVARLSTGEGQRLSLARALVQMPKVLLLDEPTAALDPEAAAAVEGLLHERLANGLALIFVTHDRHQARRLARRCLRFAKDGGNREEVL